MCLTAPGRVLELNGATAIVDLDGRRRTALTLLEPDVAVDDWVVVGGGAILRRLDAAAAHEIARANRVARAAVTDMPDDLEPTLIGRST